MSVFLLENGFEDSETVVLPFRLLEQIKSMVADKNATDQYELDVRNCVRKGENNSSKVLRIKVNEKLHKNNILSLICKLAHTNLARRQYLNVIDLFQRETYMYKVVFKEFLALQNATVKPFNDIPVFYGASSDDLEEYVLLNDLNTIDYFMYDRHAVLTFDHVRLALEKLGRYHGLSFALRNLNPTKYNEIKHFIQNDNVFTVEPRNDHVFRYGKQFFNVVIDIVREEIKTGNKRIPESVIMKLEKMRDNLKEKMTEMVQGEKVEPYAAICHGDFWNNNVMYKNNAQNVPTDALLIDFQLARYSAPVLDFSFYLMCCSEKELREKYFDKFKSIYYNALANQIKAVGCQPEVLYPEHVFLAQIKQFSLFGFCMSVFAIPYVTIEPAKATNFDKVSEEMKQTEEMDANGSGKDLTDNGHLSKGEVIKTSTEVVNGLIKSVLTKNSIPIFQRRIIGAIIDMEENNWWHQL